MTASRRLIPPSNTRMGFLWRYQHRRSVAQCLQRSNINQGNTINVYTSIYYTSIHHTSVARSKQRHSMESSSLASLLYELMYQFFPNPCTVGESWGQSFEGFERCNVFFHVSVVKIKQKHIWIFMCSLTYREAESRFANYQRFKNVGFTARFCTRIQHCKFGQNYQIQHE